MSANLSADVNFLADMPVRTLLALEDKRRSAQRLLEKAALTIREAASLFVALEAMDIDIRIDPNNSACIDIRFSGSGDLLAEVWGLLRRAGWKLASSPPQKGATSFSGIWSHARDKRLADLWMNFSSTMCRRVQIGTQMVEQPVYEVQCGELPELPTSDSAPALEAFA